jgi:hypothetical protein
VILIQASAIVGIYVTIGGSAAESGTIFNLTRNDSTFSTTSSWHRIIVSGSLSDFSVPDTCSEMDRLVICWKSPLEQSEPANTGGGGGGRGEESI